MLIRWWELEIQSKKVCVERKVGECFQWKAHGQCSKGDSFSFSHDELAQGDLCSGQKQKGRPSSPAPNPKAKTDEGKEQSSKTGHEGCSSKKKKTVLWILASSRMSQLQVWDRMHTWKNCFFRRVGENPSKKSKKGGAKGSVALLKESTQLGCVSRDSCPRKFILREEGNLGSKRAVKFSKGTWHQIKIWERKSHREELSKSVNLTSVVLARQNSGKDHMRRPCTKKDAPAE